MKKGNLLFAKKHRNSWNFSSIFLMFSPYISETGSDCKKQIPDSIITIDFSVNLRYLLLLIDSYDLYWLANINIHCWALSW